jgi:hypothetical protein
LHYCWRGLELAKFVHDRYVRAGYASNAIDDEYEQVGVVQLFVSVLVDRLAVVIEAGIVDYLNHAALADKRIPDPVLQAFLRKCISIAVGQEESLFDEEGDDDGIPEPEPDA